MPSTYLNHVGSEPSTRPPSTRDHYMNHVLVGSPRPAGQVTCDDQAGAAGRLDHRDVGAAGSPARGRLVAFLIDQAAGVEAENGRRGRVEARTATGSLPSYYRIGHRNTVFLRGSMCRYIDDRAWDETTEKR
jgi:hypothetical protein